MKRLALIVMLAIAANGVSGQYFFRGTVTASGGEKLQYVKITARSTGNIYRTGVNGSFGFSSKTGTDTLQFSYDGYETAVKLCRATDFIAVLLNALPSTAIFRKNHLSSLAYNKKDSSVIRSFYNETYNSVSENSFLFTQQSPAISFSANINRASYSNVRRFINDMDGPVPPEAVRIEEMLNYFNFHYTEPANDSIFNFSSVLTACPWNNAARLLLLNISARKINMGRLPANNIVLLIDVSGSMDMPNKLPLLKSGFRMLVKNLRAIDTVSIVTYGETVEVRLDGVSGIEKDKITSAIDALSADGPTPGESGIKLAYKVAQKHFVKNGNNRIFLGADGDFNVGLTTEKELQAMIEYQKQSGVYLTCLGVGMGNYKDSKLSILSQTGNGNFAYIDNEQEAEKTLVSELTQTLFTVADNVYINVAFNPAFTTAYRLIGYDNDKTAFTDTSTLLEGGEIGSGHSLMAIFELMPNTDTVAAGNILANIKVLYSMPGLKNTDTADYISSNSFVPFMNADVSIKKAVCVVLFGMKLKQSKYAEEINWKKIQALCNTNFTGNNFSENEFVDLVTKAQKIYRHKKKNKKRNW